VLDNYKTGKNKPYDDMRVEGQHRMNITFAILKEDLVEKLGFIHASELNAGGDAAQKILSKNAKHITGDPGLIENTVNDFCPAATSRQEKTIKAVPGTGREAPVRLSVLFSLFSSARPMI